jgi:hypothetical protein
MTLALNDRLAIGPAACAELLAKARAEARKAKEKR